MHCDKRAEYPLFRGPWDYASMSSLTSTLLLATNESRNLATQPQKSKKKKCTLFQWMTVLSGICISLNSLTFSQRLSSVSLLIFVFTVGPWVVDSCGRGECQFCVSLKLQRSGCELLFLWSYIVSYFVTCRAKWDISVKNTWKKYWV